MKFSYYPGCTLRNKAKDLDAYARASAKALGFELEELTDWQCCGAVYPQVSDEIASRLAAVRALMNSENGKLITSGGRVTGTTAVRGSLEEAIEAAYRLSAGVKFANAYSRSDIGQRALQAKK